MKAYESARIGENRGRPRLWLEGFKASLAGFMPGIRFKIRKDEERTMLVLEQDAHGDRIVSRKLKGGKEVPVIDINSSEVLSIFDGFSAVRVIVQGNRIRILPLAVEIAKRERLQRLKNKLANGEALDCGSVSHGGGVLDHALHKGLEEAGIKTRLAFANEIRPELLEHTREQNDIWSQETISLAAPLQELAFDHWAMSALPKVEALFAGLPCSGASVAGKAKNGAGQPFADQQIGRRATNLPMIEAEVEFLPAVAKYHSEIVANQPAAFGHEDAFTVKAAYGVTPADGKAIERHERCPVPLRPPGTEVAQALSAKPEGQGEQGFGRKYRGARAARTECLFGCRQC